MASQMNYKNAIIILLQKIDDPYKLRTLYEVTQNVFLRDDRPKEKQRQTAQKEAQPHDEP